MNDFTPIGLTNWRNHKKPFYIKDADRLAHIYVIGKTGVGKSTLLMSMAVSDIEKGKGLCIIDPHGDIAENILNYIPETRTEDVIYFNATDKDYPIGFNPLHAISPNNYNLVTSSLISTFKKIWADSWGPRLEHILRFSLLTLLHYSPATLLDIQPLLTDPVFKSKVLFYVSDAGIINFWKNEYDKYAPPFRNEAIAPILNKIGLLIASTTLRNIVGQQCNSFKMQEVIDKNKILVCNLSKGEVGEDASALLGSIILTSIQTAAIFRASYELGKRIPFYLYIDEMHSFITLSIADMLAESRKYGLSLFLAHQYIEQLHEDIRAAIFGNIGTLISFRVGATDAEYLEKEFYPEFEMQDLISLPKHSMYIKLMIDGATSRPFSAVTTVLREYPQSLKQAITKMSQYKYAKTKESVEFEIHSKSVSRNKENAQVKLFT